MTNLMRCLNFQPLEVDDSFAQVNYASNTINLSSVQQPEYEVQIKEEEAEKSAAVKRSLSESGEKAEAPPAKKCDRNTTETPAAASAPPKENAG
jgi:hypothetical protein